MQTLRKLSWIGLTLTALIGAGCSQATPEPTVDPAVLTVQAYDPNTALDQLPTFDVSTLPTPTLARPEPVRLTTQELNALLDPFGDGALCELPCFMGLSPGVSDVQDTFFFYSRLGIGLGDLIPGDVQGVEDGEGSLAAALTKTTDIDQADALGLPAPVVEVFVEGDIVQYVYVAWRDYPDYLTYRDFVAQAGPPDRVELALNFEENEFLFQAVYEQRQFGYAVQGALTDSADGSSVCLSDDAVTVTYMGSFAPEAVVLEGLPNSQFALPVNEVLGEDYTTFIESSNDCLTINAEQRTAWQSIVIE